MVNPSSHSMATRGVAPPVASLPAKVTPAVPSQTLYIRNLPSSKIQKSDLRIALYMLFSTHGPVLDVVALKANNMRGQAHIVFRDIHTATQALRSLDGHEFLGSPLNIQYARGKSHAISKLDGSFNMASAIAGPAAVQVTELQQSIFHAPGPGSSAQVGISALSGSRPPVATTSEAEGAVDAKSAEGRGQKRPREEENEEDSDVAMDEGSDDD